MSLLLCYPNLIASPFLSLAKMVTHGKRKSGVLHVAFMGMLWWFSVTFWCSRVWITASRPRTSATQLNGRTWPHPIYGHIPKGESTHVPNGSGLCKSAHVKSLYETSIVSQIMNRYIRCSWHLFSYPATGTVTCVHTQLRATVTRTMPSIDPSLLMESSISVKSLHVCRGLTRHFAVEELHCLTARRG